MKPWLFAFVLVGFLVRALTACQPQPVYVKVVENIAVMDYFADVLQNKILPAALAVCMNDEEPVFMQKQHSGIPEALIERWKELSHYELTLLCQLAGCGTAIAACWAAHPEIMQEWQIAFQLVLSCHGWIKHQFQAWLEIYYICIDKMSVIIETITNVPAKGSAELFLPVLRILKSINRNLEQVKRATQEGAQQESVQNVRHLLEDLTAKFDKKTFFEHCLRNI